MGVFSSKKKTYVGTSVSRLMEDDALPDSRYSGAVSSLFQDTDLVPTVQDELMAGLAFRADRMYSYSSTSKYLPGNPSGEYLTNGIGEHELIAVLEKLEGAPVLLDYHQCDCPNLQHIAWVKLVRDHGYNPLTNKIEHLRAEKGTDVFLHDLRIVVPAAEYELYSPAALQQWGINPKLGPSPSRPLSVDLAALRTFSPVEKSATATQDFVRVEYAWTSPETKQVVIESFNITVSEYDDEADYFQVRYICRDTPKYWIYQAGSGVYPELDALLETPPKEGGNFYPFIHFRKKKTSIAEDSELYACSKKMAKRLGFDYDSLLDAIHENPDVKDVQQAYLGMMVPANTENPLELRYLFDFFDRALADGDSIHLPEEDAKPFFSRSVEALLAKKNRKAIVIKDKYMTITFSTAGALKYLGIGKIGDVGSYTLSYEKISKYTKIHSYRRQVTENVFEEISILNLEMRYQEEGKHWVVGDAEEDILLVPLDRSIVKTYSVPDQELLIARSLNLVCNSLVVVKVRWYQRNGFKWVMRVVAVVILIYSFGTAYQLSAALFAPANIVVQILVAAVIQVVVSIVVSYAFKFVSKELGQDAALLLAVIAAAVAGLSNFAPGIQASLRSAMLTAERLLYLALGLVQGVTANTSDAIEELQKEMDAFNKLAEEKWELLEDAQKLLDTRLKFDPFVVFGESPTQYFTRTIHSGNVGTIVFDLTHNHVDVALRLPTIADTLGGLYYVAE